ncbi:MAG: hypothetical protein ACNS60_04425 [Candidatus Cyclobacteriaceae bacterium M2_1C_046]
MKYLLIIIAINISICHAQTTSITIDTTKEAPEDHKEYVGKYIFKNGEAIIVNMKEGDLFIDPIYGVPFIIEKIDTATYFSDQKQIKISFNKNREVTIEKLSEGKSIYGRRIPYEETTPYELIIEGEPLKASLLYQQIELYDTKDVVENLQKQAQNLTFDESIMAISFYQTALKLDPEDEITQRSLGIIYLRLMQDLYKLDTVLQQHLHQINKKLDIDN